MTDGTIGTLGDGRRRLRFERRLRHAIDRVWRAITEPDELEAWLARAAIELQEGGSVWLEWLNTDEQGRRYEGAEMRGTILRVEPPTLLEYDSDVHGRLTWELRDAGGETVLTFTCVVDVPEDEALDNLAGWHVHLDFLAGWLDDGTRIDWPNWPREHWRAVKAGYDASMRPIS